MGFLNEQELEGVVWINGKRNGGVVKLLIKIKETHYIRNKVNKKQNHTTC